MTKLANQDNPSRSHRHWQAHIKAQKRSGLSRAEYCRQHKLPYHALTYWHNKLSRTNSKNSTLVPVLLHAIKHPPVQTESSGLKIVLPGNISVEVGNNFSPATLTRLLTTLEDR